MTSNVTATATSHISFIFILGEGGRNMIILTTQGAAGVQNRTKVDEVINICSLMFFLFKIRLCLITQNSRLFISD